MSRLVAELAIRGLATLGEPVKVATDPTSGFLVMSLGRGVTSADVLATFDHGLVNARSDDTVLIR